MYRRLYSFLSFHKTIGPLQFGFQENHSIEHTFISMIEVVSSTFDNKKYGFGIFLDLQKVFDTVNHNILLSKLACYGIKDIPLEILI